MRQRRAARLGRGHVPQPDREVMADRQDGLPVRAEGRHRDNAEMLQRAAAQLPRDRIPHLRGPAGAAAACKLCLTFARQAYIKGLQVEHESIGRPYAR